MTYSSPASIEVDTFLVDASVADVGAAEGTARRERTRGFSASEELVAGAASEVDACAVSEAVADVVAAGAKEATYAEIGEQCGRIIIMVPSGAISKSILFDEDGVASTIKEGTVVCDMSSVTPVESKECYEGLKDKGVGFVDAPVSGGEPGAVAGTLAIMAGGDQEDFDAMKEYFDILGSSALLIGGSGSGSVTKLANQVIVNNTIAVVSEAFVLATKAGADPEKVYHAIRGGLAGSAVLDAKIPMIDRKSTRLNSSHVKRSRMPSSA